MTTFITTDESIVFGNLFPNPPINLEMVEAFWKTEVAEIDDSEAKCGNIRLKDFPNLAGNELSEFLKIPIIVFVVKGRQYFWAFENVAKRNTAYYSLLESI